jgi:hypothetical protein
VGREQKRPSAAAVISNDHGGGSLQYAPSTPA